MLVLISLNKIAQIQIGIIETELQKFKAHINRELEELEDNELSGRDALLALVFEYEMLENHERIQFAKAAYQDSDTQIWLNNHFGFDCLTENPYWFEDSHEQWLWFNLAKFLGTELYPELEMLP